MSRLLLVFRVCQLVKDGTLIAARYVHRLRTQKRDDRSRRLGYFHAFSTPKTPSMGHSRQASDNIELLHSQHNSGDPEDPEDAVLDIRPPDYMPVLTHDHHLPAVSAPSPPSSPPYPLLDTASGRRVRALPPRPAVSPVVTNTSRPEARAARTARLPNPHEPTSHPPKGRARRSSESDDEQSQYTTEVSTNAHAALMDHAGYMASIFSSAPPVPNHSQRSLR